MKKTQHILSFLLIPAFLLGSFAVIPQAGATKPTPNANFAIASVSSSEFSPSQSTAITINGASFTDGLKAGIIKSGNEIASATGLKDIAAVFSSDTKLTTTVPSGLTAGEYDLYVYDPNQSTFTFAKKEEALVGQVVVTSDIAATYAYSNSNAARRKVNVTFTGLKLQKKRWLKVRINGKNVPILKLTKSDNATILRLNVKFKGFQPKSYSLNLTYKNRVREQYYKKNQTKKRYRNSLENGKVVDDAFLTII